MIGFFKLIKCLERLEEYLDSDRRTKWQARTGEPSGRLRDEATFGCMRCAESTWHPGQLKSLDGPLRLDYSLGGLSESLVFGLLVSLFLSDDNDASAV